MQTCEGALALVLEALAPLPAVEAGLGEALGRILAAPVTALADVPPFTNSAMDGFALRAADAAGATPEAPAVLPVAGVVPAGAARVPPLPPGSALRIMTGAPLPPGADAVVPLEWAQVDAGSIRLARPPRPGQDIRQAGEDVPAGGRVLEAGARLSPGALGVLAALGRTRVPIHPAPRVAVITTGDELVDASEAPGPGRIRDANLHALCAQVLEAGGVPVPFPRVPDGGGALAALLAGPEVGACDVVVTNGGVSAGDFDPVKGALAALGAREVFHRVAMKPGGPFGFWRLGPLPVFGVPGNPVAAMLVFETFVRPALRRLQGHALLHRPEVEGRLDAPWRKSGPDGKRHLLRAVARETGEGWRAALTGPQGSGLLTSMLRANAFVLVPEDVLAIPEGGAVRLRLVDRPEDH